MFSVYLYLCQKIWSAKQNGFVGWWLLFAGILFGSHVSSIKMNLMLMFDLDSFYFARIVGWLVVFVLREIDTILINNVFQY